jgi:AraC family transcriptional regulator of adaptative response/methylated-DNA-[protein]-cysteine methyltransferase
MLAPRPPPIVATVHALMREIDSDPTRPLRLADLARRAGYSASHLQRQFTSIAGNSPMAYQAAARLRLVKDSLRSGRPVLEAIDTAGFGSTSRLYEHADRDLGMTPSAYRDGGAGLAISYAAGRTRLGRVMIGATDRGICSLAFGKSDRVLLDGLRGEFPAAQLAPMPAASRPQFRHWMSALDGHLTGKLSRLDPPLDLRGTAFQLLVWRFLRTVPRGETRSYAEVARGIGREDGARAVARACASNRIAVLIPCHRVVRGDGDLSGYRWGNEKKRALLEAEGAVITRKPSAARR